MFADSNHCVDGIRLVRRWSGHLVSRGSFGSRALGVILTLGEFLVAGALAFELELFLVFALLHHLLDAELFLLLLELLLLLALHPLALPRLLASLLLLLLLELTLSLGALVLDQTCVDFAS